MTTKIRFFGGSTDSLRSEFSEREKYKRLVKFNGMLDTLYSDHLYGLINSEYESVYLINSAEILSSFPGTAEDVYCLNFVARAFEAFRQDYNQIIETTSRRYPPFLDGLTPSAGYGDFEQAYSSYITYNIIKYAAVLSDDDTVDDYKCFIHALKDVLKNELIRFPVTKSGFNLSRHNNVMSSGLAIELATLEYDSDFEKGEIIQSDDFSCYADYATAVGFFVDKNSPWRLYADIESMPMKAFMKRASYDPEQRQSVNLNFNASHALDTFYRLKTHDDDLYNLQDFVIRTYNQIKKDVPFITKKVYNKGKREKKTFFRPELEFLSSEEWLEFLLMVRLLELSHYTEERHKELFESVKMHNQLYGPKAAISKIGNICSTIIKEKIEKREDNDRTY